MGAFDFICGFLWLTIGWWFVPGLIIFLGMTAAIFFFRMIGFFIVQLTDKY
jgi:hypothetical protein